MPRRTCSICKRLQNIPMKQKQYLILDDKIVCSKECVLKWINEARVGKQLWWEENPEYQQNACFKSKYEKYFAMWLTSQGIKWQYEKFVFQIGNGFYIPDFWLPDHACFLETKGKWGTSQKKKFRRFHDEHPEIDVLVVSWLLQEAFYPEEENPLELK